MTAEVVKITNKMLPVMKISSKWHIHYSGWVQTRHKFRYQYTTSNNHAQLKTDNYHNANFFDSGGASGCHNDKLWCYQWPQSWHIVLVHYNDVIMGTMASQITSLTIVYSTVRSGANQRKHQSSASLAFVREFTGDRWIPRTDGQ